MLERKISKSLRWKWDKWNIIKDTLKLFIKVQCNFY